jgi:hypothetical protein
MGKGASVYGKTARILAVLGSIFALIIIPSSSTWSLEPVLSRAFSLQATPVLLNENEPRAQSIGALRFVQGWSLTSENKQFGSLSGLAFTQTGFAAVSDYGGLVWFNAALDRGYIAPLPRGCGYRPKKSGQDAESIVINAQGVVWIGMEGRPGLCIKRPERAEAAHFFPPLMGKWRRNGGPESVALTPEGGMIVIAEQAEAGVPDRAVAYFPKVPLDAKAPAVSMFYRPPSGFDPTEAVFLPNGRLLVINRSFNALLMRFTVKLTLIDQPRLVAGARLEGREIAHFDPPVIADNFEGVAARAVAGGTEIWLLSDDNFMSLQRTLLLKFILPDINP